MEKTQEGAEAKAKCVLLYRSADGEAGQSRARRQPSAVGGGSHSSLAILPSFSPSTLLGTPTQLEEAGALLMGQPAPWVNSHCPGHRLIKILDTCTQESMFGELF